MNSIFKVNPFLKRQSISNAAKWVTLAFHLSLAAIYFLVFLAGIYTFFKAPIIAENSYGLTAKLQGYSSFFIAIIFISIGILGAWLEISIIRNILNLNLLMKALKRVSAINLYLTITPIVLFSQIVHFNNKWIPEIHFNMILVYFISGYVATYTFCKLNGEAKS